MDRALGADAPREGVRLRRGEQPGGEPPIQHNASEDDRTAGARIFRERCAGCHGTDGSGGPVAPSLARSQYIHGDSDLAIYQVLEGWYSGHGHAERSLTLLERLQVIVSPENAAEPIVRGSEIGNVARWLSR